MGRTKSAGRSPIYTTFPLSEYSEIIDVRSPGEFTEDRIPGAVNLPVLDNEERAKVGTLYKQSPFEARKLGASIVSQNIAQHLSTYLATKDKSYSPLVYCWRGGQRSHSFALVLTQIGWQVTVLEGGYKTYRAYVREQLSQLPQRFTYQVLCGLTGTGKTHILQRLAQRGVQVLDLEGLANHRGSLLGQAWDDKLEPQPSQKRFESLLLQQLQSFEENQTVWVESESNKIGDVHLPPTLWDKMKQAQCIEVQLAQRERVEFLLQEYPHLVNYPHLLKTQLQQLKSRYGGCKLNEWLRLIDEGKWYALVADLLESHYDPAYSRSMRQTFQHPEKKLKLADLSASSVEAALDVLCSSSSAAGAGKGKKAAKLRAKGKGEGGKE
ncbi:MAG: tRNA 2-selenouridine(34) synthase MnmH [Cyanophyceae cyanobacterium]